MMELFVMHLWRRETRIAALCDPSAKYVFVFMPMLFARCIPEMN
jgi:hypothetical protein